MDPVGSGGSDGSAEVVAASAPQTLPSTRAGGQDDVSSNKLPQIISRYVEISFQHVGPVFRFFILWELGGSRYHKNSLLRSPGVFIRMCYAPCVSIGTIGTGTVPMIGFGGFAYRAEFLNKI